MMTGFSTTALERRYAFLDDCPASLVPTVVTLPIGTMDERVAGVRCWHDALLAGRLPKSETWPKAPLDVPVRQALDAMGLVRFCKGQPVLVNELMKEVLSAFRRQSINFEGEVATKLRELEKLERATRTEAELNQARREKREVRDIQLDDATCRRLQVLASEQIASREWDADAQLLTAWGERARAWSAIAGVFDDLGEILGRGWDLSTGVLKHTGWLELVRLRKLVEQLPQLVEIVRALGRLQSTNEGKSVAETIFVSVRRLEEERLEIRTPLVSAETRGIERSGDISRMLPAEAAMLCHPRLRLVWHARCAERALLTYRVEGIDIERRWVEREELVESQGNRPRPERGPIIAIIDTSGSMHGLPEKVAKAIVLEAVRTAHAEKRPCLLYAYSGPGQVLEQELNISPEGIGRLLPFLGLSFGGGNDEVGMLSKVLTRLTEKDWQKADVIFVSDGEWPAPTSVLRAVEKAREAGTRFHGVQIGNRGQTGLHAVCEPVHLFNDWASAGGWR